MKIIESTPVVRQELNRYIFQIKTISGEYLLGFGASPAACREACKQIPLLYFICEPLTSKLLESMHNV